MICRMEIFLSDELCEIISSDFKLWERGVLTG